MAEGIYGALSISPGMLAIVSFLIILFLLFATFFFYFLRENLHVYC